MTKFKVFFMALLFMAGGLMGKAEIVSGGEGGLYTVKILYDRSGLENNLAKINERLEAIPDEIEEIESGINQLDKDLADANKDLDQAIEEWRPLWEEWKASLEETYRRDIFDGFFVPVMQQNFEEKYNLWEPEPVEPFTPDEDMPDMSPVIHAIAEVNRIMTLQDFAEKEISYKKYEEPALELRKAEIEATLARLDADIREVWCADYTLDLAGVFQTLEIKGQPDQIILAPGYVDPDTSEPHWNMEAGALTPILGMTPAQAAFNWAILPGWQKWKPMYLVGEITAIDSENDTADITFDDARSVAQNLPVAYWESYPAIPVEYMDCNATAFEVGDLVVVEFAAQDWTQPRVVGFVSEPKGCGLTVIAAGWDIYDQVSGVNGQTGIKAISAGGGHSLLLTEHGTVIAVGNDTYDQASGVNGQTGIKAISAGGLHSLLLTEHGTVIAVGNDSYGQWYGQVSGVNGQTGIKAISAGRLHSLLLTEHGTVIAAGWDYYDQVSGVNGQTGIKAISAGRWHSLLLTEHGTVIAVGLDTYGQVSGVNGQTGIKAISAGDGHSLLLTEHGTVIAVGDDWYGQVSGVNGQTGIKAISAGTWHSLLLTEHGTVIAAGDDRNGQVSGVNGQTGIKAISGGSGHSLLLER